MKQIFFLSGLPRTGSTVLSSMLSQHPDIHATTTSPVADLAQLVLSKWGEISPPQLGGDPQQIGNITRSVISGAHAGISKNYVVDKNRLWPRLSKNLHLVTGVRPKIICTVRDITEIIASYITFIQPYSGKNFVDDEVVRGGAPINLKNRCNTVLDKFINYPYMGLLSGYQSGSADIHFVEYNDIVNHPQLTMDRICDFMGCGRFKVNTGNLQPMDERSEYNVAPPGWHKVRPVLAKISRPSVEVLGTELQDKYSLMKLEFWRNIPNNIPSSPPSTYDLSSVRLEGDSLDYDLLYRAALAATGTDGLYCEIGVRRGGSLRWIIDAVGDSGKTVVAIDPYGNIDYNTGDSFRGKLDYTNQMKHESMPNIYNYVSGKNVNLVFFNLEDSEFFNRFSDGVPVYNDTKRLENTYAFVFYDGPHDVGSINSELDFFMDKTTSGSVFVFDDVAAYNHGAIHNRLISSGWTTLEVGAAGRKISYVRT